ncbi:MAG TPA: P-loop NTPase [Rhizomicrobium sp.]|nr:P-loop NTPase [Rhizomicrobium sp.]
MSSLQSDYGFAKLTAVGSGKGGTGKTFVTVTLAHALAHLGEKILLCDADLGLSNTALHLGLDDGGDIGGVLAGKAPIDKAVVPVFGGIKERGGFDLLGAPAGTGALANAGETGASQLLTTLRFSAQYDRVLLDLGAGVDAMVMRFAAGADENILVMTPDPAALTDAYAFTKLLAHRAAGRKPSILVNMAAGESEARRTADALISVAENFLKLSPDYLGSIPRDAHALAAVRRQMSLLTLYPQCPASQAIEAIARKISGRGEAKKVSAKSA